MKETAKYYPIFLNLKRKKCVVVGGGKVALRKVKRLLEYGAAVEVISPHLCPELADLYRKRQIQVTLRVYQTGDLQQASLVFVATGNTTTNRQVTKEAKELGIPVNVADDAGKSSFILPSIESRGDITLAVSTNGISPALARKIRTNLAKTITDEYIALVNLVGEVRADIKKMKIHPDGDDWQEALDFNTMLGLIKKGDKEKAKTLLLQKLKNHKV